MFFLFSLFCFGSLIHTHALLTPTYEDLQELQNNIDGEVITDLDTSYEEAISIWTSFYLTYPLAVVFISSYNDASAVINFIKNYDISFRIRSGRHMLSGFNSCDNCIIIDVSQLKSSSVSSIDHNNNNDNNKNNKNSECKNLPAISKNKLSSYILTIDSGITLEELVEIEIEYEIFFPHGNCPEVGIGGFIQGGGLSLITPKYGLSIDYLYSVTIMDYNGNIIIAKCDNEYNDLFYAIRGGGSANWGIILNYSFYTIPIPKQIYFFDMYWNFNQQEAKTVVSVFNDLLSSNIDNNFGGQIGFVPGLSYHFYGVYWNNNGETFYHQYIEPKLQNISFLINKSFQTNFSNFYHIFMEYARIPPFYGEITSSLSLKRLSNHNIEMIINYLSTFQNISNIAPFVQFEYFQGIVATSDIQNKLTSFAYRNAYVAVIIGIIPLTNDYDTNILNEKFIEAREVLSKQVGVAKYMNFHTRYIDDHNFNNNNNNKSFTYLDAYYGRDNKLLRRLQQIKCKYDPDNLFHYEQSIPINQKYCN